MLHLCLPPRWNLFVVFPDAGGGWTINKRGKRGWGKISGLLPLVNTQHSNSWTTQDKMKLFKWEFPFSSNFLWNFRGWSFDFLQDAAAPPSGGHLLWILLERSSWRWLFSPTMSLVNICLLRGDFSFQQCFFSILLLMTIAVYLFLIFKNNLSSNVSVWEELDIKLPFGDFLTQKYVYFKKKSYFDLLPI